VSTPASVDERTSPGRVGGLLGSLRLLPGGTGGRRALRLIERNLLVYRSRWVLIVSGAVEPLFYLLSIGVGLGHLVGRIDGVPYRQYLAPALLATAAMNGAVFDSTFNIFWKLKYQKTYDAVLATPLGVLDVALGEIGWALMRGALYALSFLLVMLALGLVHSAWVVLALPAAVVIGFGFAGAGMAASLFMRSWQDFEFVQLVIVPLSLFSGTFYPLSTYPGWLQLVVQATPLYHGVALLRALSLGHVTLAVAGHVVYLVAMGTAGLAVAAPRLQRLLLR